MHGTSYRCNHCSIRHGGVCSALRGEHLVRLGLNSRTHFLSSHQNIFHEGDEVTHYANIRSGVVKMTKTLADGRQHIVGLLYTQDFLGALFIKTYKFNYEAATDVELCCFSKLIFEKLLVERPELEHRLFECTLRELDVCRDLNMLLARKSSYERVCSFIYIMARRASDIGGVPGQANHAHFRIPLTRSEMADYLGLTLETVSRQFSLLKQKRIIALPSSRDVYVPDMELLSAIASIESCGELDMDRRLSPLAK